MSNWPYPRIVAHRGGGKLAPENTLASIDVGAKYGHKMIEFDAKLSKDGEIFLLHDDNLERTSNGWGVAGELNWQDLLRVDAGSWYSKMFKGEPLPLLSQVAERCREHGMMANIEIKPTTGTGLESIGENLYTETQSSGAPNESTPGLNGAGLLYQGYVETSNVNVAEELVNMIQVQRAYEINSNAVSTTDQMLQKLTQL